MSSKRKVATPKPIRRQGMVLLVSVGLYGLATALFGVSTRFALSYVLFSFIGGADTVSAVIRGTLRQMMTPDHLRGRMVSVNMMFFMGGPQLGELEAGLVAAAFGAPFAIFTGGVATMLLTAWVAWNFPSIRNYRSEAAVEAT